MILWCQRQTAPCFQFLILTFKLSLVWRYRNVPLHGLMLYFHVISKKSSLVAGDCSLQKLYINFCPKFQKGLAFLSTFDLDPYSWGLFVHKHFFVFSFVIEFCLCMFNFCCHSDTWTRISSHKSSCPFHIFVFFYCYWTIICHLSLPLLILKSSCANFW